MIAMPRPTASTVVVALLATILLSAGCGEMPRNSGDSGDMEIRTYTVPEGMDPATLRARLGSSLSRGDQLLGTVVTYPDGSLAVTAPASVQEGIEALIAHMNPRAVPEPQAISIDYWIVVGRPDPRPKWPPIDHSGQLFEPYEDDQAKRDLSTIVPALEQIRAAQGPMIFRLLEKQSLTSAVPGGSRMVGRFATAEQQVSTLGSSKWLADIEITVPKHSIRTRVNLESGKLIVLGESGYGGTWSSSTNEPENPMLYYVISADID